MMFLALFVETCQLCMKSSATSHFYPPVVVILSTVLLCCSGATIRHIVLLVEENRSFDHVFGFRAGVNGLNGTESNPIDPRNLSKGKVVVSNDAPDVALCDPDHDLPPTTWKIYGPGGHTGPSAVPMMDGFVSFEDSQRNESASTHYCGVMQSLHHNRTPVLNALADAFVLMDAFHASVPGPTWPNRMFCLSGTSAGQTETDNPWFQGMLGVLFPQRTIFDQLSEAGLTWRNYVGDGPWELFMESIAKHPENILEMGGFYEHAASGTLPNFSYISPRAGMSFETGECANDMHPDHSVAEGELLIKNIYEALVASPTWNETLFIITYDEHGGFYDHVPPPTVGIPAPDNFSSFPDTFHFDRLGIRIPTLLISPWVPRGVVESSPPVGAMPTPTSAYDLTSIISTTRQLFRRVMGNTTPLTKRDAWAATFGHVLSEPAPRSVDTIPLTLPNPAPRPHYTFGRHGAQKEEDTDAHFARALLLEEEAQKPVNGLQRHISTVLAHVSGTPPIHLHPATTQRHVSSWLERSTSQWKRQSALKMPSTNLPTKPAVAVRCQSYLETTYWSGVWKIHNSTRTTLTGDVLVALTVVEPNTSPSSLFCLLPDLTQQAAGREGSNRLTVHAAECLASNSSGDRAPSQDAFVWALGQDYSIYYYATEQSTDAATCITSNCADNTATSSSVKLEACLHGLEQRWSVFPANPDNNFSDEVFLSQGGVWAIVALHN